MYFEFISKVDGKKIFVQEWSEVKEPKGVIQISHGMAEHSGRYAGLAEYLNGRGYIVFADDHRAHGLTDKDSLGYSDGDIYSDTLADLGALTDYYKEKYGLPIVFFGHSYGSFLGQRYIEVFGDKISGAVIGGSGHLGNFATRFGGFVAGAACAFGRAKKPANLIKKLTFDAYDKKVGGSFISSLSEEAERYFADPMCAFTLSNAFYRSFFKGIIKAYSKPNLEAIPKSLPVLLISGASDPVGEMGKGVAKMEKLYTSLGISAEKILYDGVRHEYLNDTSRASARAAIADFADSLLK